MYSNSLLYSNSSNPAAGEPIARVSLFQRLAEDESQSDQSEGEVPAVAHAPETRVKVTRTKRQRTRLRAEAAKKARHLRLIPLRREHVKSQRDLVHIEMMERVHSLDRCLRPSDITVAEPGVRRTHQSGPEVASIVERPVPRGDSSKESLPGELCRHSSKHGSPYSRTSRWPTAPKKGNAVTPGHVVGREAKHTQYVLKEHTALALCVDTEIPQPILSHIGDARPASRIPPATESDDVPQAIEPAELPPTENGFLVTGKSRLLSRNGNINDSSIPDYVEVPHEETDDDFTNLLCDSESESDFGDNGYVDPTSSSEGEDECYNCHPNCVFNANR